MFFGGVALGGWALMLTPAGFFKITDCAFNSSGLFYVIRLNDTIEPPSRIFMVAFAGVKIRGSIMALLHFHNFVKK